MKYKAYFPIFLTLLSLFFSLAIAGEADACTTRGYHGSRINGHCVHFSSSGCGNMDVDGSHLGHGAGMCAVYGQCGGPSNPPPPPTCPLTNRCIGKNIVTQRTDCSYVTSDSCPIGCNANATCKTKCPDGSDVPSSGVCSNRLCADGTLMPADGICAVTKCPDGSARPANGICAGVICINGSSCVSSANACGMTNGKKDCFANTCIAPSDSLCLNSCTGSDGVLIENGETRNYFTGACSSSARLCLGGVLQGDTNASNASCGTGATGGGTGAGGAGGSTGAGGTGARMGLPVITSFISNPSDVNKGQSCTLAWNTSGAINCKITGTGITGGGVNAVLPNGNKMTPPITATSAYTLTCSNSSGSAQKVTACRLNPVELEK